MAESRKVIKIFLASPGDLGDERLAAKSVINKVNEHWADFFGYQIELLGWEDTVSSFGRPQANINRDVQKCEYFVGMMWKRWGTKPGVSSPFTSGFEEEFAISVKRREETGRPEISLFFKNVGAELQKDLGKDFEKVLAFKKQITDERTLMYEEFADVHEFKEKLERCVVRYLQRIKASEEDLSSEDESVARISAISSEQQSRSDESDAEKPFSPEGAKFLREFVTKTEGDLDNDPVSGIEVGRFRLLGSMVGDWRNDEQLLGVHDANLLFANRSSLGLGRREQFGLVKCGLENFPSEQVPLWRWLAETDGLRNNLLPFYSIHDSTKRREGALAAMQLISEPVLSKKQIKRERFVNLWFEEDTPNEIKAAALRYLGECGTGDDLLIIQKEFDRGHYQTASTAVDAILRISLRSSREQALNILFELQPESVEPKLLGDIFQNGTSIPTKLLLQGVQHPNSGVRGNVTRLLEELGALDIERAENLLSDTNANIRFRALRTLVKAGRPYSTAEAKKILVKPKPRTLGLFGGLQSSSDKEGEACWDQYRRSINAAMTSRDLKKAAARCKFFDRAAVFALDERFFSTRGKKLREAIDDRFKNVFAENLKEIENQLGSESDLLDKAATLEASVRDEYTREGMAIISRKRDPQDLSRIRNLLNDKYDSGTDAEVSYLQKFGEWEDVPLLIATLNHTAIAGSLSGFPALSEKNKCQQYARAILRLARGRLENVLALPMPTELLSAIIFHSSDASFRSLDDGSISLLLRHEIPSVRKIAALKCVRVLSKRKIAQLLDDYISSDQAYFYNVVHWLDLGISVPKKQAHLAASRVLERDWQK